MPAIDWNSAIGYALPVQIAESVQPSAEYSPGDIAAIQKFGYAFSETLYGNKLATYVDPHLGETATYGFLAISLDKELVAIVRGTDMIEEWVRDAEFPMIPNPIQADRE